MNLGEMVNDVLSLTKRPEKVAEVRIAINDAILHYSLAASFAADLVENTVNISPTEFAQNISISTTFPRFRKLQYLKPTGRNKYLKHIQGNRIITDKGCEQLDAWYRSGDFIYFKLSQLATSLEYGYYAYPAKLVNNTDTHWMLDVGTHMIRAKAIADIFESIGDDSSSQRFLKKAQEAFIILRDDLATAETVD